MIDWEKLQAAVDADIKFVCHVLEAHPEVVREDAQNAPAFLKVIEQLEKGDLTVAILLVRNLIEAVHTSEINQGNPAAESLMNQLGQLNLFLMRVFFDASLLKGPDEASVNLMLAIVQELNMQTLMRQKETSTSH